MKDEREVIVIDKPEKWTDASKLKKKVEIETHDGPVEFEIRGMSCEEHSKLILQLPVPEAPIVQNLRGLATRNEDDKEYQMALAAVKFSRYVVFVNACAMDIPGDTLDLKTQWASEHIWHKQELQQLSKAICELSGFGAGRRAESAAMPVIVRDAKKWAELAQRSVRYTFRRSESEADFDVAFDLKPISRLVSSQIELACPDPEIPEIPQPGIGGRVKKFIKNENDPRYLAQVQATKDRRMILVIEASLGFKLPGDDFEKKGEWLFKRPAGEVTGIWNYALGAINNFQNRSDFL